MIIPDDDDIYIENNSKIPLDKEDLMTQPTNKPHFGRISQWKLIEARDSTFVIFGTALDHPVYKGRLITTSQVLKRDDATGEIETQNSRYTLVDLPIESSAPPTWRVGDWVVFELKIGQIKTLDSDGTDGASFADGISTISGNLLPRFRLLSLVNKIIIESVEHYYKQLDKIDGAAGFNYPDIHRHFCQLALNAIDNPKTPEEYYTLARAFIKEAKDYRPTIQGVKLFRRSTL